ncbi:MAG: branched-chain amino acid transaminase [Spirochaetota bacterium]|nr:branched-chain amino acid transaminase [Spirochaetota bacterium]
MASDDQRIDYAYFQGKIIPTNEANISIKTHALQYGTGCFCGIRAYWNEKENQLYAFRLKDHYKRFHDSAKILMMKPKLSIEELIEITRKLLAKNEYRQNSYIRPIMYKSALALSPRLHDIEDDIAIYTLPMDDYLDINNGLKCKVSSWIRITENMIPTRSKATGGYINSALAKSEAILNGYDEAIFLDHNGNISEGSAENIFIVRDGKLITPSFTDSILEGITRRSIIEIAKNEMKIDIQERTIGRSELYIADEAFFCGTGVQIAWIKEIDKRVIGKGEIGPITKKIRETYFNIVTGNNKSYKNWLTEVY